MAFDFDAAVHVPHRMQPGLRRLRPGDLQLTPSAAPHGAGTRHLREKLAVLGAFGPQALLRQPGFDDGPALAALAAHAAAEHPRAWQIDGARWRAVWLGWQLDGNDHPVAIDQGGAGRGAWPEVGAVLAATPATWRRAALLALAFAEDFAVVDGATGTLPWLAVALPSMWAPEEKIGLSFADAHAPVADNRLIVGAAPQLVRLVTSGTTPETPAASPPRGGVCPLVRPGRADGTTPETPAASPPRGGVGPLGRSGGADGTTPETPPASPPRGGVGGAEPWERFVWTLTAHPRLHGHPQRVAPERWAPELTDDQLAAQTWWRTERQTFIPVPGTRQSVFTILVNVAPMTTALRQPAQAARVHDALASMTDAVLAYRGLTSARPALLRWLARQAAGGAAGTPA